MFDRLFRIVWTTLLLREFLAPSRHTPKPRRDWYAWGRRLGRAYVRRPTNGS